MPLSGLVDGEPVVSCLLTEEEWAQLKDDVRAKRRTATMRCGWKGLAKTSKLGTQYFAHAPGGDSCSAGESAQQLRAKAVIVEAIARAGWTAQTEVPGDGWVADVMATRGDVRVVFEVQWSRQDLAEYRHRQNRYLDSGIAGIAWFARHADGLPRADKQLPVFGLDIDDAGEATVMVGAASIPLAEAVDRLLTRRLQHREYVANGQPALVIVGAGIMGCYRCHKEFGAWTARQTIVEGRCGRREIRDQRPRVFAQHRAEALPEVRAAGEQMAQELGVAPGRIFRRYTQTAGKHYMRSPARTATPPAATCSSPSCSTGRTPPATPDTRPRDGGGPSALVSGWRRGALPDPSGGGARRVRTAVRGRPGADSSPAVGHRERRLHHRLRRHCRGDPSPPSRGSHVRQALSRQVMTYRGLGCPDRASSGGWCGG